MRLELAACLSFAFLTLQAKSGSTFNPQDTFSYGQWTFFTDKKDPKSPVFYVPYSDFNEMNAGGKTEADLYELLKLEEIPGIPPLKKIELKKIGTITRSEERAKRRGVEAGVFLRYDFSAQITGKTIPLSYKDRGAAFDKAQVTLETGPAAAPAPALSFEQTITYLFPDESKHKGAREVIEEYFKNPKRGEERKKFISELSAHQAWGGTPEKLEDLRRDWVLQLKEDCNTLQNPRPIPAKIAKLALEQLQRQEAFNKRNGGAGVETLKKWELEKERDPVTAQLARYMSPHQRLCRDSGFLSLALNYGGYINQSPAAMPTPARIPPTPSLAVKPNESNPQSFWSKYKGAMIGGAGGLVAGAILGLALGGPLGAAAGAIIIGTAAGFGGHNLFGPSDAPSSAPPAAYSPPAALAPAPSSESRIEAP